MPNDSDTVAAEGLKNTQGIDDEVIGSRVIDSAQASSANYLRQPEYFIGAETISASNPLDSTRQ